MLTFHEKETCSLALAKMIGLNENCVVVVDSEGRLAGLLTRGDILRLAKDQTNFTRALKEVCNANPKFVSLTDKDYIEQAALIIEGNQNIDFVLVLDSKYRPIGCINKQDMEPATNLNLEYPTSSRNFPRWISEPQPLLNEVISRNEDIYISYIDKYDKYMGQLMRIPFNPLNSEDKRPYYNNTFIPPLDTSFLYLIINELKPKRYLEVGSGYSTQFARQAISDSKLSCKLISIDPKPRTQIDSICDEVIRCSLETVDMSLFDTLEAGDILFTDNSHRSFMNSDVTVVFTEILPRLKKGVAIHFHDIFLPYDYPFEWRNRFYNEQYLLAAVLLNSKEMAFDIIFPSFFVSTNEKTNLILRQKLHEFNGNIGGGSFWIVKR